MSEPVSRTTPDSYGVALLTEEGGEILDLVGSLVQPIGRVNQLAGKAGRFGLDTPGVRDPLTGHVDMTVTPRLRLNTEVGDLLAAVDYLIERDVLDGAEIDRARTRKRAKLLDPEALDNLGRRLAP